MQLLCHCGINSELCILRLLRLLATKNIGICWRSFLMWVSWLGMSQSIQMLLAWYASNSLLVLLLIRLIENTKWILWCLNFAWKHDLQLGNTGLCWIKNVKSVAKESRQFFHAGNFCKNSLQPCGVVSVGYSWLILVSSERVCCITPFSSSIL